MFALALWFGVLAYAIFLLGITNQLYPHTIFFISATALVGFFFTYKESLLNTHKSFWMLIRKDKFFLFFLILITVQCLVNLIGALGPELGFDALWYHLTFPKLYLLTHGIHHIPGGLLYYSDMPKLGELLYVIPLTVGNEVYAKLLHYFFGLLCLFVTYKLARTFLNQYLAIIAVAIVASNLVFNWESITAYVDLIRTFYEVCALSVFFIWYKDPKKRYVVLLGILVGFAVTTKLIALGSIGVFALLFAFVSLQAKHYTQFLENTFLFVVTSLLIPMSWFIFSYVNTHNPIYPFFTSLYPVGTSKALLNPVNFVLELWHLFTAA